MMVQTEEHTRRRRRGGGGSGQNNNNNNPSLIPHSIEIINGDYYDDSPIPSQPKRIVKVRTKNKRNTSSSSSRKRRHSNNNDGNIDTDESFICLFLRVATSLAFFCLTAYLAYQRLYPTIETNNNNVIVDDDDDNLQYNNHDNDMNNNNNNENFDFIEDEQKIKQPKFTLPVWNLTERTLKYDAYAMAEKKDLNANNAKNELFWQTANGLREEFATLYGGINSARAMLDRGVTSFDYNSNNKPSTTVCRILQAKEEERTFNFVFGGYSVTAGRGNYFTQSYPFVMEKQLHTVFHVLLGIDIKVHNAAIGGCPSFPYGWCMKNFFGNIPDVISWDFSMNEPGDDPIGLEAYIRHVLSFHNNNNDNKLSLPPKLIVKDTHMAIERKRILKEYVMNINNFDPIILHSDPAIEPFINDILNEQDRPIGFQEWRKFGAPLTAPGQSLHHPGIKEHELLAWLLTMHFLESLEYIALHYNNIDHLTTRCNENIKNYVNSNNMLPKPININATTKVPWSSTMFGEEIIDINKDNNNQVDSSYWRMNPIYCHTTFDPIMSGNLSSIVINGTTIGEGMDIMLPKSKMFYNTGWVLDMSDEEKKAKRNLNRLGLGFIDNKKAYYGIYTSGEIKFLLPYITSNTDENSNNNHRPSYDDFANEWYKSIIICEVNEQRSTASACITERDVSYTVGGIRNATFTMMNTSGTIYLGKKLCSYIPIPKNARLGCAEKEKDGNNNDNKYSTAKDCQQSSTIGLIISASVHNQHIVKREEACSISHVIWEQKVS